MLRSKLRKIHGIELENGMVLNLHSLNQTSVKYSMQIGFVRIHVRVCLQSH